MSDDSVAVQKVLHGEVIDPKLPPVRFAQVINCHSCDLKHHYRYTREELIDRFYRPNGPAIKPCIADHCMDVIWLNYKLEDSLE